MFREFACFRLGVGEWFSENIEAGDVPRVQNHEIFSLARISLFCGVAVGNWNSHMACRDTTSNSVVARTICAGQIVGPLGRR